MLVFALLLSIALPCLTACSSEPKASAQPVSAESTTSTTSGPAFEPKLYTATFHNGNATGDASARIDTSAVSKGYVAAKAKSKKAMKFQVEKDGTRYNYDLSNTGKANVFPLNMGDGSYTFSILQNTSGNRYALVYTVAARVELESELAPFLRPNVFCQFTKESDCVAKAAELTASAQNQGDALAAIYDYVVGNIQYDTEKAQALSGKSGYYPVPDVTFTSGKGICFDYSSLTAAMLRSVGIPCKIVTGYVTDEDLYHAWNMVYIDGAWQSVGIQVKDKTWTRIDTTYAAGTSGIQLPQDAGYRERYVY